MEMSVTNQPPVWQPMGQNVPSQTMEASRTGLALISDTQHMDVSLVTDEGDTVTLSLDSRAAALSVMNEEAQEVGHGNETYEKNELTMGLYQRDMTFTVEGDLSKEEMRDIRKILKSLDKMMRKFVKGQTGTMAAQAGKLADLDTIAGLEANMSYERQTFVAQQNQAITTYTQNGLPAATRPEAQEISDEGQSSQAADLVNTMARKIRSTPTPVSRMMQFVNQLMKDYRQQSAKGHRHHKGSHKGPHMIDQIHHKLNHALKNGSGSWRTKH